MVDKTTGETSLLAYDNTLTISATNEDLDKYNIVKKYDNVGNNNLVPSESSIYANITDGTNSTIIMDEDGLTGLTMTIDGDKCSLDATEFLKLEANNGLAFTGFYKNGIMISPSSTFTYTITKGIAQVIEARFTPKVAELRVTKAENSPSESRFKANSTYTAIIKNALQDENAYGYLYSLQDVVVGVTLPTGYIIDEVNTTITGNDNTILESGFNVINNEEGSTCASIVIPYKLVAKLIENGNTEIRLTVAYTTYTIIHQEVILGYGVNYGEDTSGCYNSIDSKFTIDDIEDLTIWQYSKLNTYIVEFDPSPSESTDLANFTYTTYYYYYNPFVMSQPYASATTNQTLEDSRSDAIGNEDPKLSRYKVISGQVTQENPSTSAIIENVPTGAVIYTLTVPTYKNNDHSHSELVKRVNSGVITTGQVYNEEVTKTTTLTEYYILNVSDSGSSYQDFTKYNHIYTRLSINPKNDDIQYYSSELVTTETGEVYENGEIKDYSLFIDANQFIQTELKSNADPFKGV